MSRFARIWSAGILLAAAVYTVLARADEPAGVSSMDAYLWNNRPVVVFAPDTAHPILAAQRDALSVHRNGLGEREMILIEVTEDGVTVDGRPAPGLDAAALRARYGVKVGAAVALLVGKDGGVKLRQGNAFAAETLFSTIDAMPMRRQEMRTRGQGQD